MITRACQPQKFSLFFTGLLAIVFCSCSVEKRISKSAKENVLDAKVLLNAHVGLSVFDPAENKWLYNYQGDKYFVPASNTKIPTCYAAMKYLGDSLVGLRYQSKSDRSLNIIGTGDPTFLHPDFKKQPVLDFLLSRKQSRICYTSMEGFVPYQPLSPLGSGWSWNDYNETYMAERSNLPIYGNVVKLEIDSLKYSAYEVEIKWKTTPAFLSRFVDSVNYIGLFNRQGDSVSLSKQLLKFSALRNFSSNEISLERGSRNFTTQELPFYTDKDRTAIAILEKDFNLDIGICQFVEMGIMPQKIYRDQTQKIYSQPTDSLLKPMMHRSDNFFAEQALLMVSNEKLGIMNDEKIIDTLLKTDFKDLPQKPRWVDGCGLSRYNLFTPQDIVTILNKMKNEFGMERVKVIFATGGEGTISNYYKADSGYVFGKTGTLSGVVAFSGFVYTKKGKLLIFSTIVNNHQGSATDVRRAVEKFVTRLRNDN